MSDREIEVRFLEIDVPALVDKLRALGAEEHPEQLAQEIIFYDREMKWRDQRRLVRLRQIGDQVTIAYKHHQAEAVDGAQEIELTVDSFAQGLALLTAIDLKPLRRQEKKRWTFELDGVSIDIDTWPKIPAFVELEGESEAALQRTAAKLGLDWQDVNLQNARTIIEEVYGIPVSTYETYTFSEVG